MISNLRGNRPLLATANRVKRNDSFFDFATPSHLDAGVELTSLSGRISQASRELERNDGHLTTSDILVDPTLEGDGFTPLPLFAVAQPESRTMNTVVPSNAIAACITSTANQSDKGKSAVKKSETTRSQSIRRHLGLLTLTHKTSRVIASLLTQSAIATLNRAAQNRYYRFTRVHSYELRAALADEEVRMDVEDELMEHFIGLMDVCGHHDDSEGGLSAGTAEHDGDQSFERECLLGGSRSNGDGLGDRRSYDVTRMTTSPCIARTTTKRYTFSDINTSLNPFAGPDGILGLTVSTKPRGGEWYCTGIVLPEKYSRNHDAVPSVDTPEREDYDEEEWLDGDDFAGGGLAAL